ncbi:hypothetical protein EGR_10635 [Echinococcus granulosus]|uniref:Uncharacterized protein n=1 Tax=Echinococcus granulosus TaxID=6210 RepID=W6ULZ1_ECHGR|nr:hypothetical protein EGR_10635 [Echinococcus granulosus]EUB54499.1 hypothetical protein EGR_10635 [Echinococcus granulosus]
MDAIQLYHVVNKRKTFIGTFVSCHYFEIKDHCGQSDQIVLPNYKLSLIKSSPYVTVQNSSSKIILKKVYLLIVGYVEGAAPTNLLTEGTYGRRHGIKENRSRFLSIETKGLFHSGLVVPFPPPRYVFEQTMQTVNLRDAISQQGTSRHGKWSLFLSCFYLEIVK